MPAHGLGFLTVASLGDFTWASSSLSVSHTGRLKPKEIIHTGSSWMYWTREYLLKKYVNNSQFYHLNKLLQAYTEQRHRFSESSINITAACFLP